MLFLQLGLNGQAGAKPLFMGWDPCPVQPDSILHDPRLLPSVPQLWKGRKKKGEGPEFQDRELLPSGGDKGINGERDMWGAGVGGLQSERI